MDGKQFFRQCCKDYGIECDDYFKLAASSAQMPKRFYHKFNRNTMKDTQLFAVCYFEADDLYLAWNLHNPLKPHSYCFSLEKSDLKLSFTTGMGTATKAIEYIGHGEETVIAFAPKAVSEFLKKYIAKN